MCEASGRWKLVFKGQGRGFRFPKVGGRSVTSPEACGFD